MGDTTLDKIVLGEITKSPLTLKPFAGFNRPAESANTFPKIGLIGWVLGKKQVGTPKFLHICHTSELVLTVKSALMH